MTKDCNCNKICDTCICVANCDIKKPIYYDNTYYKEDCLKNLITLEKQFTKIKNSIIKYIGLVSELASITKQQSDKSIGKIDRILKNYENIQNSFINELIIACSENFTDEKNCISMSVRRKGDTLKNFNTLLYSGLDVPKELNILLNENEKINLYIIPALRIDLTKNNYLTLKITELSNLAATNDIILFKHNDIESNIYNLSNDIVDIDTEFYRDVNGDKIEKENANLIKSFDYLIQYFHSITCYTNTVLYENLHLENVIDEVDIIINHIKTIKRSPILHS